MTLALGATGVVCGYIAYRGFRPQPSHWDAAYAAIQLLAFNTLAPPDGAATPTLLHVARWMAATGVGLTIMLVLFEFGVVRVERLQTKWTRNHRVVVGATSEAIQLALISEDNPSKGWRPRHRAILVGTCADPRDRSDCQAHGVLIASPGPTSLPDALRGARDVVIAESDDLASLEVAARLIADRPNSSTPMRVVVRSSHLARSMRELCAQDPKWSSVIVVTIRQTLARQLAALYPLATTERPWGMPAVLLGCRDDVTELADALLRRSKSRNEMQGLRLLALAEGDDETWRAQQTDRFADRYVDVSVEIVSTLSTADSQLVKCLQSHETPGIAFLVGLPSADSVGLGTSAARRVPTWQIVSLVDRPLNGPMGGEDRSTTPENWSDCVAGQLLQQDEASSWRLTDALAVELVKIGQYPGKEVLRTLIDACGSAEELAVMMIKPVAAGGWRVLQHTDSHVYPMLSGQTIHRFRESVLEQLATAPSDNDAVGDEIDDLYLWLPTWLREIGWELVPTRKGQA